MAESNLRVKISGDLADIKSALVGLQGQLKQTGNVGASAGREASGAFSGLQKTLVGFATAYLSIQSAVSLVKSVVQNTIDAERAQVQLAAALASSGGAAGLTATELNKMAEGLQAITRFDDDAITGAQTLLLQFDRIGKDVFPQATTAVLDFAERMGTDLPTAAKAVGKALQDPEKGLRGLKDAGVQLDDSQIELVKHLVEVGDMARAQAVVLGELTRSMGGAAEAGRNTLGGALDALKVAAGNLLEGDTGGEGLKGVRTELDALTAVLNDPATKQGFQALIQGFAGLTSWALKAAAAVGNGAEAIRQTGLANALKSYDGLITRATDVQKKITEIENRGATSAGLFGLGTSLAQLKAEQAELVGLVAKRIQLINKLEAGAAPGAATPVVPNEVVYISGNAARAAADQAADAAKRKVEALRREMAKLREESERADEARRKELIEVEDRAAKGLAEVELALQRASGDEAGAAFAEIDASFKQLIGDLKISGNAAGIELVDRLINLQKFDAQIAALRAKGEAAVRDFGTVVATSEGAANAGEITGGAADDQIEAARLQQLETLKKLRAEALAYYRAHSGSEAKAALEAVGALDGQIRQLEDAQSSFKADVKDLAGNSLIGFFNDLIAGAKSFKEAFADMLRGFLSGVAQMIARRLALQAVDAIFKAFHSGGVVGAGGSLRSGIDISAFGAPPRFHGGGLAGLGPNEMPAILERGEEVLTRNDARHVRNLGRGGRAPSQRIVLVDDQRQIGNWLVSPPGVQTIIQVLRDNPGVVREIAIG